MIIPTPLLWGIIEKTSVDIRRYFKLYQTIDTTQFDIKYDSIPKIRYDSIRGRNYRSNLRLDIKDTAYMSKYMTYLVFGITIDIFSKNVEICRRFRVCCELRGETITYMDDVSFFEW